MQISTMVLAFLSFASFLRISHGAKSAVALEPDEKPGIRGGFTNVTSISNDTQNRRLNIRSQSRWKDRSNDIVQVPYSISSGFNAGDRALIEQSIQRLTAGVKVVNLFPRTNQAAYIEVRNDAPGCWSTVGKHPSGKSQKLNLGGRCAMSVGIIQHEFLHALGLHHEQVRPDRDEYVTIDVNNIYSKNLHNFEKQPDTSGLGAPYEYGSVMHYSGDAFAIDKSRPTTPKQQGATLGQQDGASEQDLIDVRLLYQCRSGPRNFNNYQANLCTSDCKCWEGANGCDGNDSACQGSLVCSNNQCTPDGGGSGGNGSCTDVLGWTDFEGDGCSWYEENSNGCPEFGDSFANAVTGKVANEACCVCGGGNTGGGCTDQANWTDAEGDVCEWYEDNGGCALFGDSFDSAVTGKTANEACCTCGGGSLAGATFYEFRNAEDDDKCLDLLGSDTTNGNTIQYYPCNDSPAQKWWVDSNFYIRSGLNTNKCVVGQSGDITRGTDLMIYDCLANDDRFAFYYYTDGTFRPKNDSNQCVGTSRAEQSVHGMRLVHLWDCSSDNPYQVWSARTSANTRGRFLHGLAREDRTLQEEDICGDLPLGWYDPNGDNCEWYADGTRCEDFGSTNMRFGKTANMACCACGGGSDIPEFQESQAIVLDNPTGCYDIATWRDSVGDGCSWYAQGDNCEFYGAEFANSQIEFRSANDACCACGGGSPDVPPSADPDEDEIPGCSDSPSGWVDGDGDDCAFYALDDNCELYGNDYESRGKTAGQACCACGGGNNPNGATTTTSTNVMRAAGGEGGV